MASYTTLYRSDGVSSNQPKLDADDLYNIVTLNMMLSIRLKAE